MTAGAAENQQAQRRGDELADTLLELLRTAAGSALGPVVVIATALKRDALHPRLLRDHAFVEHIALTLPKRPERLAILNVLLGPSPGAAGDDTAAAAVAEVAFATEGYTPLDLSVLLQRARHQAALRGDAAATQPTAADWTAAQAGFTPSSLRGVKAATSTVSWRDIGGTRRCCLCRRCSRALCPHHPALVMRLCRPCRDARHTPRDAGGTGCA